jgi:tetratricopeptide (TPR) repeat protein
MKFVLLCVSVLAFFVLSGCNSGQSRMARGDSLLLRGQYQLALEHYISAQQKDPTLVGIDTKIREADIRLYLQRGDEAVQNSKWDTAERCYREVRRLDSTNGEVVDRLRQLSGNRANEHFRRGQKLLGRGNPFDAIAEFEQALTFQPDHPRATESLDRAFKEKRDREADAETAFQDGMRSQSIDNLEESVQYFTSAQNLNPHHPTAEKELRTAKSRYTEALVVKVDATAGAPAVATGGGTLS